jgi:hypothetical protein
MPVRLGQEIQALPRQIRLTAAALPIRNENAGFAPASIYKVTTGAVVYSAQQFFGAPFARAS